jgi:hypothetical protein
MLSRGLSGYLTAGGDGIAEFSRLADFGIDDPINVLVSVPRAGAGGAPLDFHRKYRNRQFYGFVQDDMRLLPRLTINLGVRYEANGSLVNTGHAKDTTIQLGDGSNLADRIRTARWFVPGTSLSGPPTEMTGPRAPGSR